MKKRKRKVNSMKFILRFLKPYKVKCMAVLITIIIDVVCSMLVPTITADMINIAVSGGSIDAIIQRGILMLLVSFLSGGCMLAGSWLCAKLSAGIGKDIRNAVYDKSLEFSSADFEEFGTASMITRTLNDINVIQQAFVMFIQMVIPVPFMCVVGIFFAFKTAS